PGSEGGGRVQRRLQHHAAGRAAPEPVPRRDGRVPALLRAQGDARQVLLRLRRPARRHRHDGRDLRDPDADPDRQDRGFPGRAARDGVLEADARLAAGEDGARGDDRRRGPRPHGCDRLARRSRAARGRGRTPRARAASRGRGSPQPLARRSERGARMSPLEGRRPRALAGATGLAALCALALASAWSDGTARAAPRAMTAAPDFDAAARAVRATLADLVAADTSNPPGNESRAARIAAKRLEKAGIPFEIDAFAPGRENLVARLRGDGTRRPLLLLAHTDVVGAEGQSWTSDPHRMVERDGFLVGRGVLDDLGMAAVALEVVILLHAQRAPLARDVVLAWT